MNAEEYFKEHYKHPEIQMVAKESAIHFAEAYLKHKNESQKSSIPIVSESGLSDSEFQLKRVYDWLMDEQRQPAQTKFTAGWQRNLAKEIEYRLSKHSR